MIGISLKSKLAFDDAAKPFGAMPLSSGSFTSVVALGIRQPDDLDVSEIVFRPTRQVWLT